MASSTSFKQQCPSCEAMVPIRDPALVGRKIDCPKCKYRFVVERPEEEEDDAPASPKKKSNAVQAGKPPAKGKAKPTLRRRDEDEEEEDERPKKKKSGTSTTLILGGVLGVLALVLLVGGAIIAFANMGGPTKTDNNSTSGAGTGGSTGPGPLAASNTTPADGGKKEESVAPVNVTDVSNLLPNDSETVFNYQIDRLSNSSLRDAALSTTGAFNEAGFKSTFGFPLYDANTKDGLKRVVTAVNNSKNWVFTAVRTMKPIKRDQLIESLGLEALPDVNGLKVYSVKRDMDSLSNLLIKANRPHSDWQVCLFDGQTLVFADPIPMAKFLADGGKPKQLTIPSSAPPPSGSAVPGGSATPGGSSSPGGSGTPGGSSGMSPGGSGGPGGSGSPGGSGRPGGSGTPGGSASPGGSGGPGGSGTPGGSGGPGMAPAAGTTSAPAAAVAGSYLTINPGMKAVFDKLETPDHKPLLSIVMPAKDGLLSELGGYIQNRRISYETAKGERTEEPPPPRGETPKPAKALDQAIRLVGFSVLMVNQEKIGGVLAVQFTSPDLAKFVVGGLDAVVNSLDVPPPPGNPMGVGPTTFNPMGLNTPNGQASPPPPLPFMPPGSTELLHAIPKHFLPPQGSRPEFGGPFPGGSSSGSPGPGGSSSPGGSSTPGGSGVRPAGSGATPGGFSQPGVIPGENRPSPLTISLDKDLASIVEIGVFEGDDEIQAVNRELGQFMVYLKGDADLVSSGSRIHDLAGALQKYVKEKGHFPRGTADRPLTPDLFADWAPDQRVSWMADLLPYLGDGEYSGLQVDPRKSWSDGENLNVAGILIPQFLARQPAGVAASPRARYPGVGPEVAMTNYVGVAGVGLDAAEYVPGNPKDGIFGYNRETKPADVKRGLDQTIALLQTPPQEMTPWLAGGGATVRGVSEGPDAVKPFVCTEYQRKRGTFAIMGDGKVRFIPETIDPKIFRTLCLMVGDKVENLDKIAPVVPGAGAELKTAPPVAATVPPFGNPDAKLAATR